MQINIIRDPSVSNAPAGFSTAVQLFEQTFPVTVDIDAGWGEVDGQTIDAGALAESAATFISLPELQISWNVGRSTGRNRRASARPGSGETGAGRLIRAWLNNRAARELR